jgi:hypothetical protein
MWMSSQQHGLRVVGACIPVSRCRAARDAWGRVGSHRGSPLRRFNGRGIEIKVSGPTAASELEGSLGKPPAGQHAPPVQDRKTQTQVQLVSSALSSAWPANCSRSPSSVFAISSHHHLPPPLLPPHPHRIPSLSLLLFPLPLPQPLIPIVSRNPPLALLTAARACPSPHPREILAGRLGASQELQCLPSTLSCPSQSHHLIVEAICDLRHLNKSFSPPLQQLTANLSSRKQPHPPTSSNPHTATMAPAAVPNGEASSANDNITRFAPPSRAFTPQPDHKLFHPKTRCFV